MKMLKFIGTLIIAVIVSILPVNEFDSNINKYNSYDKSYSITREVINEEDDSIIENEYSFGASPLSFWDGCDGN